MFSDSQLFDWTRIILLVLTHGNLLPKQMLYQAPTGPGTASQLCVAWQLRPYPNVLFVGQPHDRTAISNGAQGTLQAY